MDILTPDEIVILAARNGRSVIQLCRLAGVNPSTFNRWRAGLTSPSLDTYAKVHSAAEAPVGTHRFLHPDPAERE